MKLFTHVRLRVEIELIELLQQQKGLSLDEFRHIQRGVLLFRHEQASVSTCLMWRQTPFCFLARSLAMLGHGLRRAVQIYKVTHRFRGESAQNGVRKKVRLRRSRFSIGFGSLVRTPVPAFRFTSVIPLLWPRLSHSTPDTQFRVGSSLQTGLHAPLSIINKKATKRRILGVFLQANNR